MRKNVLIAAALVASAIVSPASAATILSADFSNGSFGPFTVSSGAAIKIDTGRPSYEACCTATGSTTNLTNPFAVFGAGNVPNTGNISATFATVLNQAYQLTFRYAAFGGGSTNLSYSLTGAGTLNPLVGTLNPTADNNFDTTFKTFTGQFTGTGGNVTLRFSSAGDGTNVDAGLDDVLVASVPEPATWAMMIAGFGLVGGTMRRRKTSVAFA